MRKVLLRLVADSICLLHLVIFLVAVFGWLVPSMWQVYLATIIVTVISDLIFGYCIISKWEFEIRKLIDPAIDYDYTWTTYYIRRITGRILNNNLFEKVAVVYLGFSVVYVVITYII
jgi:hypothetical protein